MLHEAELLQQLRARQNYGQRTSRSGLQSRPGSAFLETTVLSNCGKLHPVKLSETLPWVGMEEEASQRGCFLILAVILKDKSLSLCDLERRISQKERGSGSHSEEGS